MTVALACVLCDQARELNDSGLCRNPTSPDDPRPRYNACEDLVAHLSRLLVKKGRARLRTNQRTPEEAQRILTFVAGQSGLSIDFEMGDSWVAAFPNSDPVVRPIIDAPRKVVQGFVIDDLDIGKLHLQHNEASRKASLYRQMAQVEDGWQEAAVEAANAEKQLSELIAAWEENNAVAS